MFAQHLRIGPAKGGLTGTQPGLSRVVATGNASAQACAAVRGARAAA